MDFGHKSAEFSSISVQADLNSHSVTNRVTNKPVKLTQSAAEPAKRVSMLKKFSDSS